MESIIYIVEATALIEGIHFLKQWIYEDKVKLLIPICTLQALEKAAKASTAPKEESKQQIAKQTGGRVKREYPLFDINPRTAWEFVERARLGQEAVGLQFQQENEVFAQWKTEEEKDTTKEEQALPPPTSFADALLRKLALKEDGKELKASAKPKLIAKAKDQKTVWKIDKVPTLSATGMTANEKSLLSCILWRVHEAQSNPLQPIKYVLLANEPNVKNKARGFELASITTDQLRAQLMKTQKQQDKRKVKGQLEEDFPEILVLSNALDIGDDLEATSAGLGFLLSSQRNGDSIYHETPNAPDIATQANHNGEATEPIKPSIATNIVTNEPVFVDVYTNGPPLQSAASAHKEQTQDEAKPADQIVQASILPQSQSSERIIDNKIESESELDSDEEIIVFNPRNRRASGRLGSSSRPGSSAGFVQKFYKAGIQTNITHAAPPTPSTLEPQTPQMRAEGAYNIWSENSIQPADLSDTTKLASLSSLKSSLDSKLKAQSPVFTPGQPFPLSPTSTPVVPVVAQSSNSNGSQPPAGPKNTLSRQQRGGIMPRPGSHDLVRMQKENSQRMIQRQREAIQRQTHSSAAYPTPQTSNSPRLIQMEPTDSPTIIDPDAFDRTYIVQPPTASSSNNTVQRQNGHKRNARGSNHRSQGRERPQSSAGQPAEPGGDFVLKSGTPRGTTHEKGKLWVP